VSLVSNLKSIADEVPSLNISALSYLNDALLTVPLEFLPSRLRDGSPFVAVDCKNATTLPAEFAT
jgi:hypothetical protein